MKLMLARTKIPALDGLEGRGIGLESGSPLSWELGSRASAGSEPLFALSVSAHYTNLRGSRPRPQ